MSKRMSWKVKFSILMVALIIIIYGTNYLVLGDAEHIISSFFGKFKIFLQIWIYFFQSDHNNTTLF